MIVLIDKLLINLCFEYKYVLLLQSTERKIKIFIKLGILEHFFPEISEISMGCIGDT